MLRRFETQAPQWRRTALAMAGGLLVFVLPLTASAHHILGIPHYKYDESYPQIPYVEVMAQVGVNDLNFTYYPGTPKPGERVRFKLYVRNRDNGKPYVEPLSVQMFETHFFAGATAVSQPMSIVPGRGPEANDYKFFYAFDANEAYEARLTFPNGEGTELIPFPVTIGATDDRPLLFGAVGILVTTVLVVAVVKRRRRATGAEPSPQRKAA